MVPRKIEVGERVKGPLSGVKPSLDVKRNLDVMYYQTTPSASPAQPMQCAEPGIVAESETAYEAIDKATT